jgi:KaiC/GvpD/RAD55 family RecA-like ATPase
MAKKKSDGPTDILASAAMPNPVSGVMPQSPVPQPAMMPMGMAANPMATNPMAANPMFAMMQMMQNMMGASAAMPMGMGGMVDPSALPFANSAPAEDNDAGLDSDIIRPMLLKSRIKDQMGIAMGCVLDDLCLTNDRNHSLGGVPKGCTIALAGPPGKGKTRSSLAGLAKVALTGVPVAFVVAEEGFYNPPEFGRDDLCSRMTKIGMKATGLGEEEFAKKVLSNVFVMQSQYHRGKSWDDFVGKYRYLVEKENIRFVVIDSLNMLDPTRNRTADNLSALKTYNHEKGITCLCIGQIRDTGMPVGGEALMHTADVVFLVEELSLGSKEIADFWGGKYREKIEVVSAIKSVTTPILPYPIRTDRDPETGVMIAHAAQPKDYPVLPVR